MSIITMSDYKSFAGINSPNKDDQIQPIVDMANDLILRYCNTSFSPVVVTNKRVTNAGHMLVLPNCPVISVEEVKIVRAVDTILDPIQYVIEPDEGVIDIIDYSVELPMNPFSFSVSYTHGFSSAPFAIRQAAYELVTHYSKREFNKSKDLGNGQAIDFTDTAVLPRQIRTILDTYRVL